MNVCETVVIFSLLQEINVRMTMDVCHPGHTLFVLGAVCNFSDVSSQTSLLWLGFLCPLQRASVYLMKTKQKN